MTIDVEDHWVEYSANDILSHSADLRDCFDITRLATPPTPLQPQEDIPCPHDLMPWLFEPRQHNESECHTYALVDAAKVEGVVEMLDSSGLEHSCLYTRKAQEELADIAPWLVRLEPDNRFTRNLFTHTEGDTASPPWHMGTSCAALYLRSHFAMADLVKHFRRFNQLNTEDGQTIFFRYWDPLIIEDFLLAHAHTNSASLLAAVESIVVYTTRDALQIKVGHPFPTSAPFTLSTAGRQRYVALRRERLHDALYTHFIQLPDFSTKAPEELQNQIKSYANLAREIGLRDAADLFTFCLGMCLGADETEFVTPMKSLYEETDENPNGRRMLMFELAQARVNTAQEAA